MTVSSNGDCLYNAAMKNISAGFFQIYVWLVIYPVAWSLTILVAITVSVLSILGMSQFAGRYVAKAWGRIILWITPVAVRRAGQTHIVAGQSYVVVANHQSIYDILLVYGYLPLDFKWVMKIELRKMPFVGFACEKMGHIYVDRRNRQASVRAMNAAKDKLVNGTSVVFFPEGTRNKGVALMAFRKGAFKMARDLQLPILPLSISGANRVMPTAGFKILPGKVTMTFHPPITLDQINELDDKTLADLAQTAVASGVK